MYSEINLILELLDEWMKNIEINGSKVCGGLGVGISDLEEFEDKRKVQLEKVAYRIDRIDFFVRGR